MGDLVKGQGRTSKLENLEWQSNFLDALQQKQATYYRVMQDTQVIKINANNVFLWFLRKLVCKFVC